MCCVALDSANVFNVLIRVTAEVARLSWMLLSFTRAVAAINSCSPTISLSVRKESSRLDRASGFILAQMLTRTSDLKDE